MGEVPRKSFIGSNQMQGSSDLVNQVRVKDIGHRKSAEESGTQTDSKQMTSGNVEKNDKFSDNGKLPEDIPPADNDSVVEAQLRQAAIAEKDPQKKKKLWNEYRRYKGLSEK